ncbi:hypothetical protein LBMAG52_03340 [Planctomycetia bacterium]|nr:hypothetical protein LBMAG52_03340 [Planctomycetia bacterium]
MLRVLAFAAVAVCCVSIDVVAQDFSVYTKVYDLDAKEDNVPFLRSQTVFHAGKVYDAIPVAGEVTILEKAHHRIWIVNPGKGCSSSVDFDELRHLLKTAEGRLVQRLGELERDPSVSRELLEALRFQLRPSFETQFDPKKGRLRLLSKYVSYEVDGQVSDRPEAVDAYLTYADWACQLNYVLHPQPLFPTVRLALNEQLRRHKLLPTRVILRAKLDRPLNLKAEHELSWKLDHLDRQSIQKWESLLRDPKLQKVSLSEYQKIAFGQQTAKAR